MWLLVEEKIRVVLKLFFFRRRRRRTEGRGPSAFRLRPYADVLNPLSPNAHKVSNDVRGCQYHIAMFIVVVDMTSTR